jgi:regulator of sigma E protease
MTFITGLAESGITLLIFAFMLFVLVVVHELGHFVMARLANVRVLEFGIGFPPRAKVLRSEGETMYTVNWLPLGGFVRLEGEDGDSEDPRSFGRARLPVKLIILVAGVAMNALLALAIFTAIGWLPGQTLGLSFHEVQADSPAASIGLVATSGDTTGDRIIAINGQMFHDYDTPSQMVDILRANAGKPVTLVVLHPNGSEDTVVVKLRDPAALDSEHGPLGIVATTPVTVAQSFTRTPLQALQFGVDRTAWAFGLVTGGLGQLGDSIVNRPTQAPPLAGPVGIAVGVGDVFWQQGAIQTLFLAGILSANLALVNLLPFPPLDGGRMLIIVIKSLVGTRLSVRAEQLTYLVGFAFLFALFAWVTFFDIARQLGAGQ